MAANLRNIGLSGLARKFVGAVADNRRLFQLPAMTIPVDHNTRPRVSGRAFRKSTTEKRSTYALSSRAKRGISTCGTPRSLGATPLGMTG